MSDLVYVDTSAVLRAVLERGVSAAIEKRIGQARHLMTSRLSLLESARALNRLRQEGVAETVLADAGREADSIFARCVLWEMTATVCDLAAQVAPQRPLRTLDAIHLATYALARRRLGDVELLTADRRLEEAARSA